MALPYKWQWRLERFKNSLRRFSGGGNGQPRPKICPNCGTLVGIHATKCQQCGTNLRFSMAAFNKRFGGFFGGETPVTTALLVANLLMFGVETVRLMKSGHGGGLAILWGMGGEDLYRLGAMVPMGTGFWTWWRLVTAMFLHGGLIHIGFNMWVLIDIGPVVEKLYGPPRYLFAYVATGMGGYLLSSWLGHGYSIGASGAIMGLIGVLIGVTTRRGGSSMKALRSHLISWVVMIFALGFMMSGIDNYAHLGGLASGFGLGKIMQDREPVHPGERNFANLLGWLAGLVCIASFVLMFMHFNDRLPV